MSYLHQVDNKNGGIWISDWSSQLYTQFFKQLWNKRLKKNAGQNGIRAHDLYDTEKIKPLLHKIWMLKKNHFEGAQKLEKNWRKCSHFVN